MIFFKKTKINQHKDFKNVFTKYHKKYYNYFLRPTKRIIIFLR